MHDARWDELKFLATMERERTLRVLPGLNLDRAGALVAKLLAKISAEQVKTPVGIHRLSASAGVVAVRTRTAAVEDVLKRADGVQYFAKNKSKQTTPRRSALAVDGVETVQLIAGET
jgi:GGDEF domain-containing protein